MDKIEFVAKHVYKKYGFDKNYTLNDVNLEVEGGMIFGFLGPNGAGKSTFIKSFCGLFDFQKGDINLCNVDIKKDLLTYKKMIGFVPDQYILYEKSTGYDLLVDVGTIFGVKKDVLKEKIEYYSTKLNIKNSLNRLIGTYSHGMKQKIAIIASLLHSPKMWVLDEPLTGLDPISVLQVKEIMKEYASKGNIVFFSSHLIDIVKNLCTDIAIIKDGHIQCVKSIKDLPHDHESLALLYEKTIKGSDN